MVRGLIRKLLEAAGHRVELAAEGREALELIERSPERFDLVLTDVVMPHMSGAELARHIRERCPAIRIVMVSGHAERAGEFGPTLADAFLPKPFRKEELLSAVEEALAGTPGREPRADDDEPRGDGA